MLKRFLDYLGPVPSARDLWTYSGVWILSGVLTSLSYTALYRELLQFPVWLAGVCASLTATGVLWKMLRGMKFSSIDALVISAGGLCIALPNWVTIHLGFSWWQAALLTIGGILISLPPFGRGMREYRLRNPDS